MAKGLNKVMLIGRLGKDPEIKTTANGVTVGNFSIATTESKKDQNGNWNEYPEWHRVVALGKLADICGRYLHKGSQVYIEGKLQTRSWDDKKTGEKRYMTEILCNELLMLGKQQNNGSPISGEEEPF